MSVTTIKHVFNRYDREVMFVKLEDTQNNRYAPADGHADVGSCWVPHCSSGADFLKKTILVMDYDRALVLGCIWENNGRLYLSKSGWRNQNPDFYLPGVAEVGIEINLKVKKDGTIVGEKETDS